MFSATKLINNLLKNLSPKQEGVISGRFGINKSGESKTLAAIGDSLGLTRERVRQIEESALEILGEKIKNDRDASKLLSYVENELKTGGGVLKKEELLKKLGKHAKGLTTNHLDLFSVASGIFAEYSGDNYFYSFYYLGKNDLQKASAFVSDWLNYLNRNKKEILSGLYENYFKNFLRSKHVDRAIADNFLHLSKLIHKNIYGDTGLVAWPEIKPATARDRAYLILKKKQQPMHFEEITKQINDAGFSAQLALSATVHNELIKDDRFVLVGRGIYGLREHGYEPGVAVDVIKRVLKKNGPMQKKDVIAHVGKERFFKPNTVSINLQNRNYFEKLPDGKYRLRES